MKATLEVSMYGVPQVIKGKDGKRDITRVGQVVGNQSRPRIIQGQNGPIAVPGNSTYVQLHDEDGNYIGDIAVSFGSILAPRESTVEVAR